MAYTIEHQAKTEVRRGPFGLLKRESVSTTPLGIINEGQNIEVLSPDRTNFGTAQLLEQTLEVTPQGNVVIDMGNIDSFQSHAIIMENGQEKTIWIGSVSTQQNLSIRMADNSEMVRFHRDGFPKPPDLPIREGAEKWLPKRLRKILDI